MNYTTLQAFVSERKKDYEGKPDWMWEDEGVVYAIEDYLSSYEATPEDVAYMKTLGFVPEDFEDFLD